MLFCFSAAIVQKGKPVLFLYYFCKKKIICLINCFDWICTMIFYTLFTSKPFGKKNWCKSFCRYIRDRIVSASAKVFFNCTINFLHLFMLFWIIPSKICNCHMKIGSNCISHFPVLRRLGGFKEITLRSV